MGVLPRHLADHLQRVGTPSRPHEGESGHGRGWVDEPVKVECVRTAEDRRATWGLSRTQARVRYVANHVLLRQSKRLRMQQEEFLNHRVAIK